MAGDEGIIRRRAEEVIAERLTEEQVVLFQGPRAVGKSTLLNRIAARKGTEVVDLDDPDLRDIVIEDPTPFVQGPAPVCIDEYQHAPALLDAIKAELNRLPAAGRFLLTGSTRFSMLPRGTQALTGRLHVVSVWPLSQGEIEGARENLVEHLFQDPDGPPPKRVSKQGKDDYIRRIVRGGFPIALTRTTETSRNRWLDDYVRVTLESDIRGIADVRGADGLPAFVRRLAAQTGQILNLSNAAQAASIDRQTAKTYADLAEAVFLTLRLPAWGKTLRSRTAGRPKVHVVDSAIAARLLRLSPDRLARLDPAALSEFGHLLETFVVTELIKQCSWLDGIAGVGHWRTHDGDEVDLVVERDDGAILAFEVKATSRVTKDALSGLRRLRDAAGDAFLAGIALHTGKHSYQADDRIAVMPIDQIWTPI